MKIYQIVYRYRFIENELSPASSIFRAPSIANKSSKLLYQGYDNLPNNTSITTWSDDVVSLDNYTTAKLGLIEYKSYTIDNDNHVDVNVGDRTLISFVDKVTSNPYTFVITIGNNKYYYVDGSQVFNKQLLQTKYITPKTEDITKK